MSTVNENLKNLKKKKRENCRAMIGWEVKIHQASGKTGQGGTEETACKGHVTLSPCNCSQGCERCCKGAPRGATATTLPESWPAVPSAPSVSFFTFP